MGLLRIPFVGGKDIAHRIGPTGLARKADCGATERQNAAGHQLALGEDRISRGDADIAGQHELILRCRLPLYTLIPLGKRCGAILDSRGSRSTSSAASSTSIGEGTLRTRSSGRS